MLDETIADGCRGAGKRAEGSKTKGAKRQRRLVIAICCDKWSRSAFKGGPVCVSTSSQNKTPSSPSSTTLQFSIIKYLPHQLHSATGTLSTPFLPVYKLSHCPATFRPTRSRSSDMSTAHLSSSYFPPTPPVASDDNIDSFSQKFKNMASLAPNGVKGNATNGVVNGSGGSDNAQSATSPTRAGAPAKITLSLGHLPSKKEVKAVWPRTPSRVRRSSLSLLPFIDTTSQGGPEQPSLACIPRLP